MQKSKSNANKILDWNNSTKDPGWVGGTKKFFFHWKESPQDDLIEIPVGRFFLKERGRFAKRSSCKSLVAFVPGTF